MRIGLDALSATARLAEREDAAAIATIYNEGIADRIATFETRPRVVEDILAWFSGPGPIVAVDNGADVVAFAAGFAYRDRACYAGIREFSVYVARAARGRGHGRAALAHLITQAPRFGAAKLVSRIFPENAASRGLCAALGFREVGIYHRHGMLDGAWRDCVIVEKLIDGEADAHVRTMAGGAPWSA